MTTNQTRDFINGQWIERSLANSVKNQVNTRLSVLPRGIDFRLKQICGEAFWYSLTKGERIKAGLLISYLVGRHELPLNFGLMRSNSNTFNK